jgi:hypothetical protein
MSTVKLPPGHVVSHRPGYANYRGDVSHIVGEVKGPTTYGRTVVAVDAQFDPATDRTRVEFCFVDRTAS